MLWRNGVVPTQRMPRYDHTLTSLNVRLESRIANREEQSLTPHATDSSTHGILRAINCRYTTRLEMPGYSSNATNDP